VSPEEPDDPELENVRPEDPEVPDDPELA